MAGGHGQSLDTDNGVVAQAIPKRVWAEPRHFHKTECFCFDKQVLAGQSAADMPLQFIVVRIRT